MPSCRSTRRSCISGYTFTPEEGDIASIGSLSGASGFTASIQDGVVSIMPAQDGLVPGSYTLSLPTYSSTGGEVVVSFQVTVVADDFSVATAGELEAAYSIGNGKSVTLRPGRYVNFQRETNSVERTTAFRGRRFPAGITIRSDSVAQGLFDFDVQRPVIEMTVGSLDLGDTSNITFELRICRSSAAGCIRTRSRLRNGLIGRQITANGIRTRSITLAM